MERSDSLTSSILNLFWSACGWTPLCGWAGLTAAAGFHRFSQRGQRQTARLVRLLRRRLLSVDDPAGASAAAGYDVAAPSVAGSAEPQLG